MGKAATELWHLGSQQHNKSSLMQDLSLFCVNKALLGKVKLAFAGLLCRPYMQGWFMSKLHCYAAEKDWFSIAVFVCELLNTSHGVTQSPGHGHKGKQLNIAASARADNSDSSVYTLWALCCGQYCTCHQIAHSCMRGVSCSFNLASVVEHSSMCPSSSGMLPTGREC